MNKKICINKKIVFLTIVVVLLYVILALTRSINRNQISFTPKAESQKVVGGKFAKDGDYPFYVFIIFQNQYGCSGSLIGNQWVLTAKHCIQDDNDNLGVPKDIEVYANYTNIVKAISNKISNKYYYKVQEIIPYNEEVENIMYTKTTLKWFKQNLNDIVILKLSQPTNLPTISIPPYMCPIGIPINGEILGNGDTWTSILYEKSSPDLSLKYAQMLLKPTKDNFYNSSKLLDKNINIRFLISYYSDTLTSAADGDSGGPIITQLDNKKIQIGLISTASRNAFMAIKSRALDLRYYSNWITKITGIKAETGTWNGNLIPIN